MFAPGRYRSDAASGYLPGTADGLGLGTITQVMAHLTASWRVTHHITMRTRRICSCTGHPKFGLPLSRVLLPQLEAFKHECRDDGGLSNLRKL